MATPFDGPTDPQPAASAALRVAPGRGTRARGAGSGALQQLTARPGGSA